MDTAELKENFDHFDSDHNGTIDFGEFSNLLDAIQSDMSDDEKRVGFESIDNDGNGVIDFDEFAGWWADR